MKKITKIIAIVIGICLILNSIWLVIVSNMNTGVFGTFTLGTVVICIACLWDKIEKCTYKGIGKIIKNIFAVLVFLWLILITFIGIYGRIDNVTYKEDAIIVLGCGVKGEKVSATLSYRLDKAVEYYNKNKNVVIIVSGGQGPQENITEAEAMERYLIEKKIPKDKIIKEDKSTSTTENIIYSKNILNHKFNGEYQVVIITNNFHIYRASKIADKNGIRANHYSAKSRLDCVISNYIRETIGICKYYVLGK